MALRQTPTSQCRLEIQCHHSPLHLRTSINGPVFGKWALPRTCAGDEWAPVELRAIGDEFTILVEGHVLGEVRNNTLSHLGKAML